MKHSYLMVLQPSFDGPVIRSWEKMSGVEESDSTLFFAMSLSARINHGLGPLKINSDDEWTPELMTSYLHSLSDEDFKSFVKDADVKVNNLTSLMERKKPVSWDYGRQQWT